MLHFFCLFVYEITQFVQLAGIQLTIQHSSKYFLWIPNNVSTFCSDDATIFEGMSVLGGVTVFRDVTLLSSVIFS